MAAKKAKSKTAKFNKSARIRELFERDPEINAAGVMEKEKRFKDSDKPSITSQISKLRGGKKPGKKATKATTTTPTTSELTPGMSAAKKRIDALVVEYEKKLWDAALGNLDKVK